MLKNILSLMMNKFKKLNFLNIFFFIIQFLILGCAKENPVRTIRLAHGLDISHSVHKAMLKADTILNILSEGKMKIKIYPNQQLGSERECLSLIHI